MVDRTNPPVAGLGKAFAEFSLLPDLLQASASGGDSDAGWTSVLETHGFNDGHVHADDLGRLPPGGLAVYMARDARRLCERLQLLGPSGLTGAGQEVAAAVPLVERPPAVERAAAAVVGEQIRLLYRGHYILGLAELVQDACRRMAAAEQPPWAAVRGLLLAEFDTLLYCGFVNGDRAARLPELLPGVRKDVAARLEWRPTGGGPPLPPGDLGPGTFCDAVSYLHYGNEGLARASTLSLTELRVTAMAMTWSGLLAEEFVDFAISVLVPVAAAV